MWWIAIFLFFSFPFCRWGHCRSPDRRKRVWIKDVKGARRMPRVVRSGRWHQLRWVAAAARAAKVPALVGATAATLIRTTEVQVEEVPTSATGRRADRKATHLKKKNGTNIQTKPWSITVSRASPSRLSTTTKALNLTNWASKRVCCFVSTFFPTDLFRFWAFLRIPCGAEGFNFWLLISF